MMRGKDEQQRVERRPGPTPAGGAYSQAYYAEDGTIREIVEYDAEGRVIARTYAGDPEDPSFPQPRRPL